MNVDRACEILQAEEKFDVFHNGLPVWIDSIDVKRGAACVREENQSGEMKEVPVEELQETMQ